MSDASDPADDADIESGVADADARNDTADAETAGTGMNSAIRSVFVVGGVALLVVFAAVIGASVVGAPTVDASEDTNTEEPPAEYQPDAVVAEPIASEGTVSVPESARASEVGQKVVVISSDSRAEPSDLRPLVAALVRAGHEVRFADTSLQSSLDGADAFLRIDPRSELSSSGVEAVRDFTDEGGRVIMVGEPARIRITQTGLFASLTTQRSQTTALAAEYGIVFGDRYLYDTAQNDGNFKNVLASGTNADTAPDVDQVALYTATRIEARGGTAVLRTSDTTELSGDGPADSYPVAVRKDNVVAVGDKTFMQSGRHNVGDNEAFISYLLGFALSGDRGPTFAPSDGSSGSGNETSTG
jgi:hypothetical protein